MAADILDVSDDGAVVSVTSQDGKEIVTLSQEVSDVLDYCAAVRGSGQTRGVQGWRAAAEIPVSLIEILKARGIDLLGDPAALKKFLNDREWRGFRLSGGRI